MNFIGGYNIRSLIKTIDYIKYKGYIPIIDYAKEGSRTKEDVKKYQKVLHKAIDATLDNDIITPHSYALKYSSFAPEPGSICKTIDYITKCMRKKDDILLDAEDLKNMTKEEIVFNHIVNRYGTDDKPIYKTYQMYRKESLGDLRRDIELLGSKLGVKMVRGAYYHKDRWSGALWDTIEDTHRNYDEGIKMMLKDYPHVKVILATHNNKSIEKALCMMNGVHKENVRFAQLLGMAENLGDKLVNDGHKVYKYIPFGPFMDILPYLVRRLYENYDIMKYARP